MSSVISDLIDCPQCGMPAQLDEYYVTGEERVICDYCGYSHIKRIDGTVEKHKGYGTLHKISINETDNGSNKTEDITRFTEQLSIVNKNELILSLNNSEKSSLYVWNDEENKLETLVGTKPQTLEELFLQKADEDNYYNSFRSSLATDTVPF